MQQSNSKTKKLNVKIVESFRLELNDFVLRVWKNHSSAKAENYAEKKIKFKINESFMIF